MSKANGNFCCPGDTRFFLLCLPLPFSTNRFSILEPQWHLELPLLFAGSTGRTMHTVWNKLSGLMPAAESLDAIR